MASESLKHELAESRLTVSTWFPEDGPDEHYVTHIWRREVGPRYHEPIAGPFATLEEARAARDEISASSNGR